MNNRQLKSKMKFEENVKISKEYVLKSEFINTSTKVILEHKDCGYLWEVIPNSFNRGVRCPKCKGVKKKTHKEFMTQLNMLEDYKNNYKVLDDYKNKKTPIKMKHIVCGNIYKVTPDKLLNGNTKCPYCLGRKGRDYAKECSITLGENYKILSNVKTQSQKIKVKHHKCKNIYSQRVNKILMGRTCPYCKTSRLEKETSEALKEIGVKFSSQYRIEECRDILPLPFDFCLHVDKKILIECQGRQHYEDVEYFGGLKEIQKRDNIKKDYCLGEGIPLIEIPYWIENVYDFIIQELNKLGITNSLNT